MHNTYITQHISQIMGLEALGEGGICGTLRRSFSDSMCARERCVMLQDVSYTPAMHVLVSVS